jgi:hypothetical protein
VDTAGTVDLMSATGAQLATAILASQATANLYALFCSPLSDVRGPEFHEPRVRAPHVEAIRHGYTVATALVIPIGVASAVLVGSWLPAAGALVVAAAMIGAYEYGIAHPATATAVPAPAYTHAWGAL